MENLKPCPFCGCTDIKVISNDTNDIFFVSCEACESSGSCKSDPEWAIKAWNDRK